MGAVFFLVVMAILLGIGAVCLVLAIIFLVAFLAWKKKGQRRKGLLIPMIIFFVAGGLIALVPLSYGAIIIGMNATLPEDYVKTGIVIEENGYQDERFTADGVVYQAVPDISWDSYHENDLTLTAVFTYKEKGFMHRHEWGNYYSLANSHGFTMIVSHHGDQVFAPVAQVDEIRDWYLDKEAIQWFEGHWDVNSMAFTRVPDDLEASLNAYHASRPLDQEGHDLVVAQDARTLEFFAMSADGIIFYVNYSFSFTTEGLVFLLGGTWQGQVFVNRVGTMPEDLARMIQEDFS